VKIIDPNRGVKYFKNCWLLSLQRGRHRHLPEYQTVPEIAARTQALAEKVIQQAGGRLVEGSYFIPGD
jgi:hypothetical protein